MQLGERLVTIICLALMLIFAIIHFGVGVGIVARFASYQGLFRPERGLAGFNIFISIVGLIVAGFGLLATLTDRRALSRIVAFASIALAILALISLITALIINSLAINYVRSRFSNKIDQFNADPDARDVVNKIQTKYTCCGVDTWLDWSRVSLNATGSGTDNATTVTSTTSTTTTTSTTVLDSSTTAITVAPTETTTVARVARGWLASGSQEITYRKKRQDQASYGGFAGLPLSYAVTLPQSCCSTEVANTNDLNNLYCVSNANDVVNSFHTDGCGKKLGRLSVGQTLGIAVINSFLIVIALAAIPALMQSSPSQAFSHSPYVNEAVAPPQAAQYPFGGYNTSVYNPGASYGNSGPTYTM